MQIILGNNACLVLKFPMPVKKIKQLKNEPLLDII